VEVTGVGESPLKAGPGDRVAARLGRRPGKLATVKVLMTE